MEEDRATRADMRQVTLRCVDGEAGRRYGFPTAIQRARVSIQGLSRRFSALRGITI
jgi:hypothetical protein